MGQLCVKYGPNMGQRWVNPTHVRQMCVKYEVKYELRVPTQRHGSNMGQLWVKYGSSMNTLEHMGQR